ncbi:hypothetical protein AVEN_159776-1 [Araneus ventricosus]|uniref:Reverse transcriptase Ty1/copia-type domain-containing protein n=1 Tax=Araneus ventricosus TaxID=182803 RepID=A0A4Y2DB71_ARAVE|nr:hypothetical protein AVEN_159776-1 [Araneus ventricosus]
MPSWFNHDIMAHLVQNAEQYTKDCPRSLEKAKSKPDCKYCKKIVDDKMTSSQKNETWSLVKVRKNANIINCKWVFQLKRNSAGKIERHKARLVGY